MKDFTLGNSLIEYMFSKMTLSAKEAGEQHQDSRQKDKLESKGEMKMTQIFEDQFHRI